MSPAVDADEHSRRASRARAAINAAVYEDRVKVPARPRKLRAMPCTCAKVVTEGKEEGTRGNTETYRARVAVAVDAIERRAEVAGTRARAGAGAHLWELI